MTCIICLWNGVSRESEDHNFPSAVTSVQQEMIKRQTGPPGAIRKAEDCNLPLTDISAQQEVTRRQIGPMSIRRRPLINGDSHTSAVEERSAKMAALQAEEPLEQWDNSAW